MPVVPAVGAGADRVLRVAAGIIFKYFLKIGAGFICGGFRTAARQSVCQVGTIGGCEAGPAE